MITMPQDLTDEALRRWLIDQLGKLDAEKRAINAQIGRQKANRDGGWLAKAQFKVERLKDEREACRLALAEVNQRLKAKNSLLARGEHCSLDLSQAFVEIARRYLEPEDFRWLMIEAEKVSSDARSGPRG